MDNRNSALSIWARLQSPRRRVAADVTMLIERKIAAGEFKPGDKLPPEREIALLLGVSRASVRDALFELSFKGLIDRRPAIGTIVRAPTAGARNLIDALDAAARRVYDVVDLRCVIEPAVCQRAAERATPAQIDALRQNLDECYACYDPDEMTRLDREFHQLLAQASQNELLIAVMTAMADQIHAFRATSQQIKSNRAKSLEEHRRIVEAVRRRDGSAAARAMKAHILSLGEVMLANAGLAQARGFLSRNFNENSDTSRNQTRKKNKARSSRMK